MSMKEMSIRKRWTVNTSFVCSKEQRKFLEEYAAKNHMGMGEFIRNIITNAMVKEGAI